ncbi:DUF2269 family protein [Glycomyces sp. TRM65418]|uniref:DUF2269 family protein n=1 Tax=Glycomyces sp. TRM65418 TaxID=2867006 RepID=UPI001CE6D18A|nr:DUF2269 family protein [Glycomyces sp. TRM65418]MCC3765740.1 DUF2269 family protein [Glycomyces sp. TRM65418]QZD55331.1 DUF2269 family protein [Glycomyces sp. TRM65418]
MHTLLSILHVLTAVIVVGPAMLLPWLGERALRERDGDRVHRAGRRCMAFNALTVVAALFGALTTVTGERYSFADPWLIVAGTLYVVAVVNGAAVIPGTLARIGKELQDGHGIMDGESLEQHRARLLTLATLNFVLYLLIVILMAWRPGV